MQVIKRDSVLWEYLPKEIQSLIVDGEDLLEYSQANHHKISDFSYLVFPFSKAYEGFLKRLFLDLGLIAEDEYYSDDIRIGRILNPHFMNTKENVFTRICNHQVPGRRSGGHEIAEKLWKSWKRGRNQVFHYFPHNFRRLSYAEAIEVIEDLMQAMEAAVIGCELVGGPTTNGKIPKK